MRTVVRVLAIVLLLWMGVLTPEAQRGASAAPRVEADANRLIVEVRCERMPDQPPASASLSGRVLAPDGRTPVPNILVLVDEEGTEPRADIRDREWVYGVEPPYYAYTDADGAYSVDRIAPGRWCVTLYAVAKLIGSVAHLSVAAGEDAKRDLFMPPTPSWRGLVVEHDGITSVPNASVTFLPADLAPPGWDSGFAWIGQFSTSGDRRGEVRLYADPGGGWCAYMDLPFAWRRIPLSPGELRLQTGQAPQVLRLPELPALDCTVLSPGGSPVGQRAVSLLQLMSPTSQRHETRTDARGRLRVVLPPTDTPETLLLVVPGVGWAELRTKPEALPRELTLSEGTAMSGVVVGPDASPLGDAELSAEMMLNDTFSTTVASGRTRLDGTFELRGLPPGFYRIQVPGYDVESPVRLLFPGGSRPAMVLCTRAEHHFRPTTSEPAFRLIGTITRSDGRPLTGLKVGWNVAGSGAWPLGSVAVPNTGRFEIPGLPRFGGQLSIQHEGRLAGVVTIRGGAEGAMRWRTEIPLPEAALRGRVLDGVSMEPVHGATVIALPEEYGRPPQPDGDVRLLSRPGQSMLVVGGELYAPMLPDGILAAYPHADTDAGGAYRLEGLPEGQCSIAAIANDGRSGLRVATVGSVDPRRGPVDIPVFAAEPSRDTALAEYGSSVDVRVMDSHGAPAAAWILPVRCPFGENAWEPLPGRVAQVLGGECRLTGLPTGEYRFLAQGPVLPADSGDGAQGVSDVVPVTAGVEASARIVLEPFARVGGHVATADDAAVVRGWVRVRDTRSLSDGVCATREIVPLDGSGAYMALVPAGRYEAKVIVPAGEWLTDLRAEEADIPPGRATRIDITVEALPEPSSLKVMPFATSSASQPPGDTVSGRVVDDATGQAMEGVTVAAVDSPFENETARVQTDENGGFSLDGPDSTIWRPVARVPGYAPSEGEQRRPAWAGQPPLKGADSPVELRMGRGMTVEGRLVWPDGLPASRALVRLDRALRDAEPAWMALPRAPEKDVATVAPDGAFRFEHIAPGKYAVCAYRPSSLLSDGAVVHGDHGDTVSGLRLRISRRVPYVHAQLAGMPRPELLEGVEVTMRREGDPRVYGVRWAPTGGRAFSDVPCGRYTLLARSPQGGDAQTLGSVTIEPDTQSVTVDLSRIRWVFGRVLMPEGRTVPPSYSVAYGSAEAPSQGAPMTPVAPDGSFVLPPVWNERRDLLLLAGPHSVLGHWRFDQIPRNPQGELQIPMPVPEEGAEAPKG